jgi:hypothetical protein
MNKEELIFARCEQILQDDKTSQELNQKVLHQEAQFKQTLNKEQLKAYNALEEQVIALSAYNEVLIYKTACSGVD